MPRSQKDQELIRIRLLYTALIETVLFAWRKGFPVANPHKDVRFLSRNTQIIIDSIVTYFNSAPISIGRKYFDQSNSEFILPENAEQLAPMITAISQIHYTIANSSHKYACMIAANNRYDTIRNLILFFEDQTE